MRRAMFDHDNASMRCRVVPIDIADSISLQGQSKVSNMFGFKIQSMQSFDEIDGKLREMILSLDDEDCTDQMEAILEEMAKRDQRISDTLEELLKEVDELILLAEDMQHSEECTR